MPHTVKVEVSDGLLTATNEFIVTVLEVNRPPVINSVAATAVAGGGAWGSNHMMVVVLISRRAILGLKP